MSGQLTTEVIAAAQSAMAKWGVPASVTLAQYALESGWGQHIPAGSNNPFGIKSLPGQPFVTVMTHEEINGSLVPIEAEFRAYDSLADAFDDHGRLIATAPVYGPAMAIWASTKDVAQFVPAMAKHYATDPNYADTILSIINSNHMTQYDTTSGGVGV